MNAILKEENLLEEIEEFINKIQLSTEDYILRQIYPSFFITKIRETYLE